ncbi:YtxH domain-containing protein [Tellurirhabdus rosea]|uniref:YtxH domain-containing protein n=1 Tax=Tellurirhabdus rosea TaxID=2674997 RepID=UPI0022507E9B|nr:YtxH domain-containing protein [Tellurirhabdus rosea]
MKSSFSGLVVALLAGAALGVLLAPRSGQATRRKFSSDSDRFLRELQDTISSGFDKIRQQYEETRDAAVSSNR